MYTLRLQKGEIMATKNRNEYTYKYHEEHIKRIPLDVQKSEYEIIKASADAVGEPVNTYIKKAIRQRIDSGK